MCSRGPRRSTLPCVGSTPIPRRWPPGRSSGSQRTAASGGVGRKGPQVDPRRFVVVENAKQVMRSLHAALSMDTTPTPTGEAARQALIAALAKVR